MENQRGQKFCTRCGSNLLAIERARDLLGEMATTVNQPDHSSVIKVVALISIFGMLFLTAGTIFLRLSEDRGPTPIVFAIAGFVALVAICRHLLKLAAAPKRLPESPRAASASISPALRGSTNRALGEPPYQSVTEERTRQFEDRPRR
jgi:hypothetical protein